MRVWVVRPFDAARIALLLALSVSLFAHAVAPAQAKKPALSNVFGFGGDAGGFLGDGNAKMGERGRDTPVPLPELGGVAQVVSGLALMDDGSVMAWGRGEHGELGNGTTESSSKAVPVHGVSFATAVASGSASLVLIKNGMVLAWGANAEGEVGDETTVDKHSPVDVEGADKDSPPFVESLEDVVGIAAAFHHSLAVRSDGSVVEWGRSYTEPSSFNVHPVAVPGIADAVAVSAATESATALLADGEVVTWGAPEFGELGTGLKEGAPQPPQHVCAVGVIGPCPSGPFLTGVTRISAGREFDLALLEDGTVAAWGGNEFGQLGTGDEEGPEKCALGGCSATPVSIGGLESVVEIAAGEVSALALGSNGRLEGWGLNGSGQLGTGSFEPNRADSPVPAATGLTGVIGIGAGEGHSYAWGPQQPSLTRLKPTKAKPGKTLTLEGLNVRQAQRVEIGSTPAGPITRVTFSKLQVTVPALPPGNYPVTVKTPGGTSAAMQLTVK